MPNKLMLNTRNEWNKLLKKRSTVIFLMITALFPVLAGPAINSLQNRFGFTAFDGESFSLVILSAAASVYLPLLLILAVSDSFSGEQEQKSLPFSLVQPISRFKVFSSKVLNIGIYLLSLLLIICVTSLLTAAVWLNNFTFQGAFMGIGAYLLSWLPLMAMVILFIFLVQWIGSSSRAVIFSILLYLILIVLTFLLPSVGKWLPSYDTGWYQRWFNAGSWNVLLGRTVFLLSFCTMFFTIGYYRFSKKDF